MARVIIYRIECRSNGRIYVGMSSNFEARQHYHLFELFAGRHQTKELQADFNAYGAQAFTFTKIREVPKSEGRMRELQEMRLLATKGYSLYNPEVSPNRKQLRPSKYAATQLAIEGEDEVYTVPEAATILKVSRTMIYHLFNQEQNPLGYVVEEVTGARRICKSQIVAFLNAAPHFPGWAA